MSDFASLDFWYAPDLHVALPPGRETPPGLVAAALPHLREGGCLFNTSGSEGPPKWVVLEKRAFLHSARAVNALHGLERSDRWGLALPQHHVGGFSIWARAALSGAAVIPWTSPHWDPKTCHQWLIDAVIRVVSLVPTQLHDFIALALPPPPELRLVIVGGGPLATDLLRRALELGWPVTQSYGMTETASQVAAQTVVAARSDPEGDLEILPHWHLTPAEEDRAILRGSALANGWLIPDGSSWLWEPLDPQQGLLTTDRLALREDGTRSYLRFLGRHGRRVKIKGEFVSLDEVEAHLRRLLPPDFPACTVVALPHARLGHELLWVLEADSPPNCAADLLRRYHTEQPTLPALTLCSLPHFPRSDLGKVRHTDLLQRLVETRR